MDLELLFWTIVFVGGYVAVLSYLLRIAMQQRGPGDGEPGG